MFWYSVSNEVTEYNFIKRIDPKYQVTELRHHFPYSLLLVNLVAVYL